jgi:hypothetical protein
MGWVNCDELPTCCGPIIKPDRSSLALFQGFVLVTFANTLSIPISEASVTERIVPQLQECQARMSKVRNPFITVVDQ